MSLGLAVLLIGLLYLVVVSERFRRIALIGVGIVVVGALLLFGWIQMSDREAADKRELAKTYIKVTDVELIDPRVAFSNFDGRPSKITGRLRNNSHYTLEGLDVRLTFRDCVSLPPHGFVPEKQFVPCETVGEENEEIRVNIPPSQSRDFDQYVSGPILSPKGKIEWAYQVISASAHLD